MIPTKIKIGHVFRYAYLWDRESREGREEGGKDRPCLVLAIVAIEENGFSCRSRPSNHPCSAIGPQRGDRDTAKGQAKARARRRTLLDRAEREQSLRLAGARSAATALRNRRRLLWPATAGSVRSREARFRGHSPQWRSRQCGVRRMNVDAYGRRLATGSRRIGFVLLRTGGSPPAAPHPASRRRSCFRLHSYDIP